jgi:hypothetical protein
MSTSGGAVTNLMELLKLYVCEAAECYILYLVDIFLFVCGTILPLAIGQVGVCITESC